MGKYANPQNDWCFQQEIKKWMIKYHPSYIISRFIDTVPIKTDSAPCQKTVGHIAHNSQ